MGCNQLHFDVEVKDYYTVPIDEPQKVILTKTAAVHIISGDPCTAPIQICILRVVKCQKGCVFEEFEHDFPIDPSDPILPPGEYKIGVPQTAVALESGMATADVIFEDVSAEYVQAIIANKGGGC